MIDHAPSPDRLRQLAAGLERLDLSVVGEGAEARRRRAAATAAGYLAPRLSDGSDTIVVAVVGPGGGGKSTIVNSMARCRISRVGSMRPTTIEPTVWMDCDLPSTLDGLRGRLSGSPFDSLRPPPEGIVIVDTPPPGFADDSGVPIAHQVLEVADAVIFVAGATRYADADGFTLLEIAAGRQLPTVIVLNRLTDAPETHQLVAADFAAKLAARRLLPRAAVELVITIAEGSVSPATGALNPEAVAGVLKDLEGMADPQSRPGIISAVVSRSLERLRDDLAVIRSDVLEVAVRRVELLDPMRGFYRREGNRLIAELRRGKFGGLEVDRSIESLASAVTRRAGLAARATAELWLESAPGLVEGVPDLFGHGAGTLAAARERLGYWLVEVDHLSRRRSSRGPRRRRHRRLAGSVQRMVFEPGFASDRRTARRLAGAPRLIDSARDRLVDELRGILETDSLRFVGRLGPAAAGTVLTELSTGL